MKFVHIVAARPNFIKAAPVIKELKQANQTNYIIHTNQHYDYQMSKVFFEELNIPEPDVHLGVGSGTHAEQTSSTMVLIEEQLSLLKPDYVIIYGDVNSSMAGAISAAKLNIPVVHIESGCRSYDDTMPEEINRKIIDTISTILICTEESAYTNLVGLGLVNSNTIVAGNTAIDSLYDLPSLYDIDLGFKYYLATFHRPFNVDDADKLDSILTKLEQFSLPVVIPAHPRLKKNLKREYRNILFKDPFGYVEFISYIKNSEGVISDSGGVQCECAFFSKPLLTLRPSTEHLITLEYGNKLINVGELSEDNFDKTFELNIPSVWDGNASKRAVDFILKYDTRNS